MASTPGSTGNTAPAIPVTNSAITIIQPSISKGGSLLRQNIIANNQGNAVVIVGTDCPGLTADVLDAAFDDLAARDVVLGPALDGGYYLVGLRRFCPDLFIGIPWSTPEVLSLTRRAADRAGLTVTVLGPLCDVDVPGDLPACAELRSPLPEPRSASGPR